MQEPKSIVFLGASGAVGSETLKQLLSFPEIFKILLLGRKKNDAHNAYPNIEQHEIDIHNADSYQSFINNFTSAICTLGVGEPSKISKEEFVKIDKIAVLTFAKACKKNGVKHFQLLSSVGISSASSNFFLRTKGELVDELKNLQFERLSIF